MIQFDWQRPPLLLGLVLGTIAEKNLFISTRAYGMAWLAHPGVIIIGLLILGAILYSLRQIRKERARVSEGGSETTMDVQMTIVLKPAYRIAFALLWVAAFGYMLRETYWDILPTEERAALFPMIVGVPGLALAVLALGRELLVMLRTRAGPDPAEITPSIEPAVLRRRAFSIIGWILGFLFAIWLLGFNLAVLASTLLFLKFGSGEKWWVSIVLTLAAWIFFFGLFDYFLHLPFPEGKAFEWLGSLGAR